MKEECKSQSPSLRGSGRFRGCPGAGSAPAACLNPLHCGAVVASSPRRAPRRRDCRVSIPFIAGQWSLRWAAFAHLLIAFGLNPLHCGAVVASRARPGARKSRCGGLNPLHCGAVVASFDRPARRTAGGQGLNPLHCGAVVASPPVRHAADRGGVSQSPSLRGSGRFWDFNAFPGRGGESQSPSLRGSGRFFQIFPRRTPRASSLNPLHCGAVVASILQARSPQGGGASLNPLHCGAVVASSASRARQEAASLSQSPSLRGSGRFMAERRARDAERRSQSPSLRGSGRFKRLGIELRRGACLNPLHCGAVVASPLTFITLQHTELVSIPFIAGQWSLHAKALVQRLRHVLVSIPFIAGQWSLLPRTTPLSFYGVRLRKRRLPCDHVLCARLHVWPKPVILL